MVAVVWVNFLCGSIRTMDSMGGCFEKIVEPRYVRGCGAEDKYDDVRESMDVYSRVLCVGQR